MVPRAIQTFVGFASVLRAHGFAVAPDQTMNFIEGIGLLGPRDMRDIYRAARALFAIPREREAEFAALFQAHFLGQTLSAPAEGDEDDEVEARESTGAEEDIPAEQLEEDPGQEASGAERLASRPLAAGDPDAALRNFRREAPHRLPRRSSRRRQPHAKGDRPDLRRALRDAARRDGEIVTLPRTRRRTAQRRVVLLIDVSGSMAERTESSIRFAHLLVRTADRAEVFTLGTRLTRITSELRRRDPAQALEAVARSVADFDGGTRLGGALAAFMNVPRFAASARGAAVTVLSDGLERGDPGEMITATHRLSRIAWRLDWLTPLAGDAGFAPRTAGLSAVLPYLDTLGDGSSPARVAEHLLTMAGRP